MREKQNISLDISMIDILAEGNPYQCIPLDIELQDGIDEIACLGMIRKHHRQH